MQNIKFNIENSQGELPELHTHVVYITVNCNINCGRACSQPNICYLSNTFHT